MAIFGSVETIRSQHGHEARFRPAFAYLAELFRAGSEVRTRVDGIASGQSGRVELDGGSFALEQVYRTKPRAEGFFESHRRYIDVQVIVSGEEHIEVAEIATLQLKEDRTPGNDVLIYAVPPSNSVLCLRAGEAAILYPVDGHMPQIAVDAPREVRKVVIKVPVGL